MKQNIKVNKAQKLYVIPSGNGYSCLGFKVCIERIKTLAPELNEPVNLKAPGTLHNYKELERLEGIVLQRYRATGFRAKSGLSPQLVGLEGKRVEVVTEYGETRRFQVGKSTGWIPCHLEIARRTSTGGGAASMRYKSVRLV